MPCFSPSPQVVRPNVAERTSAWTRGLEGWLWASFHVFKSETQIRLRQNSKKVPKLPFSRVLSPSLETCESDRPSVIRLLTVNSELIKRELFLGGRDLIT